MATLDPPAYTPLPERAAAVIKGFAASRIDDRARTRSLGDVPLREPDPDGSTEVLDGVRFTHHRVSAPGDYDVIDWHYVECGAGEPIVFLHGLPDSWYLWHHQMAALAVCASVTCDQPVLPLRNERRSPYCSPGCANRTGGAPPSGPTGVAPAKLTP